MWWILNKTYIYINIYILYAVVLFVICLEEIEMRHVGFEYIHVYVHMCFLCTSHIIPIRRTSRIARFWKEDVRVNENRTFSIFEASVNAFEVLSILCKCKLKFNLSTLSKIYLARVISITQIVWNCNCHSYSGKLLVSEMKQLKLTGCFQL